MRIVGTERDEQSGIIGYDSVVETSRGIRDGLEPLLRDDTFLVVLGGCCTLVPGVAAALRLAHNGPLGLAYIDGHLDTYDGTTSQTGEAADMPVAIVAGIGDRALIELGTVAPLIAPKHIALLGYRDTDEVRRARRPAAGRARRGVAHDAAAVRRATPAGSAPRPRSGLRAAPGATGSRSTSTCSRASRSRRRRPSRRAASRRTSSSRWRARSRSTPACVGIDIVCYDVDLDDAQRSCGTRVVEIMQRILAPG